MPNVAVKGLAMLLDRVDRVEVLVVVDNVADSLLPPHPCVRRAELGDGDELSSDTLLAEHGLCLLITAIQGSRTSRLLLDAGYSPVAAPRNLERLGESLDDVSGILISHGHEDHVGSIGTLLDRAGSVPVIVHPEAFRAPRYFKADDGRLFRIPQMISRELLENHGAEIVESREPVVWDGCFLVTGEIPRRTPYEQGLPGALRDVDGELVDDPVLDDQAVVLDVAGAGLVVISGCAHAGIINTVHYACDLVHDRPVHAVIGGFHLGGEAQQPAVEPTLDALLDLSPAHVVPMHCTGRQTQRRFHERLGATCIDSAVGTVFVFEGASC